MRSEDIVALATNIDKYAGKTVVLKCGGETLKNPEFVRAIAVQIAGLKTLGCKPVVVHGGGPQINQALKDAGIEAQFDQGVRITDSKTLEITIRELSATNTILQAEFMSATALLGLKQPIQFQGISAHRSKLILAHRRGVHNYTGDVVSAHPERITNLINSASRVVPVISPISADVETDEPLNVNADHVAGALANALNAERLLLFSDVERGVMDGDGNRLAELDSDTAQRLIDQGVIREGMKVKVETCLEVLSAGKVDGVVILHPRDIAEELFTAAGAPSATLLKLTHS